MPWQQRVADVALEVDPDTGLLAYREVRVTVPRQSGKTTLLLGVMIHRALGWGRPQRIAYAAQTRQDARDKWEEQVEALDRTPLHRLYRVRRTNGSEAIRWANGSRHVISGGTEKAGHGMPLDLPVIDEAFAQRDDRIEQAFKPAMITRASPQLWIVSTAGTAESLYLRRKVDDGRARVERGERAGVAYFEWSATDDEDPADPVTWRRCMPALGHTIREPDVAADQLSMAPGEFARAFLNRWTTVTETVIDLTVWASLADPTVALADPVAFAVDVAGDRSSAAIAAADATTVEIIDHRPGTGWVPDRLAELIARHRPLVVAWDPFGPVGSLDAALIDVAGGLHHRFDARDQAGACGDLFDAVNAGTLRHRGQVSLDDAVAGAGTRTLLDAWAWSRSRSRIDIAPLVAATEARYAWHRCPLPAAIQ